MLLLPFKAARAASCESKAITYPPVQFLEAGSGRDSGRGEGYFALFENRGSDWALVSVTTHRPSVTDLDHQEVLYFSNDITFVQPDYRAFPRFGERGIYVCDKGLLAAKALAAYNPCRSALTSAPSVALNIAAMAIIWPALMTGTVVGQFAVDKKKVLALIQQTGVLDRVRSLREITERERFLTMYRNMFATATTSSQFDAFMHKYSDNDPENLIPQASARRDELSKREAEEIRRREAEVAMRKEAQAKAEKEQRLYEQEQRRQRLAQIETFRRSIKIETETNCGPVLEIKGALVKVYFPVANYGNEHWIRKELLFPPQYGCRFFNGNYQTPSL